MRILAQIFSSSLTNTCISQSQLLLSKISFRKEMWGTKRAGVGREIKEEYLAKKTEFFVQW